MTEMTAATFRQAAADAVNAYGDTNSYITKVAELLLAAAEQREALEQALKRPSAEDIWREFIEQRIGDAEACQRCAGMGVYTYGSTSTWQGGPGGQMMTTGVCDRCWGSGMADKPWPSHRAAALHREQLDAVTAENATLKDANTKLHSQVLAVPMIPGVTHDIDGNLWQDYRGEATLRDALANAETERDEALAKLTQVHAWMTSDDGLDGLIAIMKDTAAWRSER